MCINPAVMVMHCQVGGGTFEFVPAPTVSSQMIGAQYSVPSTLLVRFAKDGLDETDIVLPLLQDRAPTGAVHSLLHSRHS